MFTDFGSCFETLHDVSASHLEVLVMFHTIIVVKISSKLLNEVKMADQYEARMSVGVQHPIMTNRLTAGQPWSDRYDAGKNSVLLLSALHKREDVP